MIESAGLRTQADAHKEHATELEALREQLAQAQLTIGALQAAAVPPPPLLEAAALTPSGQEPPLVSPHQHAQGLVRVLSARQGLQLRTTARYNTGGRYNVISAHLAMKRSIAIPAYKMLGK